MRSGVTAARDTRRMLDLCEQGWAPALRGRALVAEAEPECHADMLPVVSAALIDHGPDTVAERWPACLLMAVVGGVVAGYSRGSAWSSWWRRRGRRPPSAAGIALWDRAFRHAAAEFGLAAFADLDGDQRLLAHSGVPDAFLAEFCTVLSSGGAEQVSAPVTLLLERPEAAAFVDGCRAAMAVVEDGGSAEEAGIPRRFSEAVALCHARGGREVLTGGSALVIEPFGRGPLLAGADGSAVPVAPDDLTSGLFVFEEDGAVVPEGAPLPGTVWLLYPAGAPPETGGVGRIVTQGPLPVRWAGWTLVEQDLSDAVWLRGGDPGAVRRVVGGRDRPALVTGVPVEGLCHPTGRPVFGEPPALRLPAGDDGWSVEVRDRDGGILARERIRGVRDTAMETSAFWTAVPRPLLGEYSIRVGGRSGSGLIRSVVMAEGFVVACFPDVRLLCPEGLEPAEAVCHTVSGMTAVPMALALGGTCANLPVEAVTRHRREPFLVQPPRMRVRVEGLAYDVEAVRPLRLDLAGLARAGRLFVELPGAARPPDLDVVAGGRVVQTVRPHRDGGYNLRRVLDTAASYSDTVLRLAYEGRTATVALMVDTAPSRDPWLPPQ